jgi:hydrogenase maturation protease
VSGTPTELSDESARWRVLVAGVGNIFLSDDGFGSEVARRLARRTLPGWVHVVDYGIRGIHLAHDLMDGYAALLLIDTVPQRGHPGRLTVLQIERGDLVGGGGVDAHAMDPALMLGTLESLGGVLPRTLLLGCEPLSLAEGMELSPEVAAAVDDAVDVVVGLLSDELAPPEALTARSVKRA